MSKKLLGMMFAILLVMPFAACNVEKEQEGEMPEVEVQGGQMPEYDVDAPEVEVGTDTTAVEVPEVDVNSETETITTPDVDITPPADDNDR